MRRYVFFKVWLALSCLALITACSKDEPDTNQLTGDEVSLKSFGPSPIARGAELRIIGVGVDQVESVIFAGPVTVSTITKTNKTEIRVTVPQEALPGPITLVVGDKQIVSQTALGFNEPIAISGISPLTVKSGGAVKIEGEYLNLIEEVIFADDVHVLKKDFVSQSRQAIELKAPATAQTGKIIVSNGADLVEEGAEPGIPVWVYSESVLNVVLPVITELTPQVVKPGEELTITGTDFDLTASLKFGDSEIVVSAFTVSETNTKITVTVPVETTTGDVKLVAFSGVEVSKALDLTAPAITSITPNPAQNNGLLTIAGTDLDLVTAVVFAGDVAGEIQSQTATQIVVEIPATAVAGDVLLQTYSGQTAKEALSLVEPTISGIAPLSITAGDNITITGNDLDLVREVIFTAGAATVSAIPDASSTAGSLVVKSPFAATDGTISIKTVNGTVVTSGQSLTIAAATLPIVTEMPLGVAPGALLTVKGVNLETVTKIEFVYTGSTIPATRFLPDAKGETLQVYVPADKGDVTVRLYAGIVFVDVPQTLIISSADPVVDPSYVFFDFNDESKNSWWGQVNVNNVVGSLWEGVENDPTLQIDGTPYAHVNNGSGLFFRNGGNNLKLDNVSLTEWVVKFDVRVMSGSGAIRLLLESGGTQYMAVVNLTDKGDWYSVAVPFSDFLDGYGSGTNALPDLSIGEFGATDGGGGDTMDLLLDNVRFEKIE
jgi:hypothetical protein